jgi:hypothetical protein
VAKAKGKRRPMAGEVKSGIPPTGIIRTLPYFGTADAAGNVRDDSKVKAMNLAYRRMMRAFKAIERTGEGHVLIALSAQPKIDVLHCYLIVGGQVRLRARIAGYQEGENLGDVACWDNSVRSAKVWAILCAPVEYPPEPILRRGFQGFRYTTDLW